MARRRRLVAALAVLLGAVHLPTPLTPVPTAGAADPPWTLPSMPAMCTAQQAATGAVEGCLVNGAGRPESRGWPEPPFPARAGSTTIDWVDVGIGATGQVVRSIQEALTKAGFPTVVDGSFGAQTQAKVMEFQMAEDIPPSGVVDQETAAALGVLVTGGWIFPPPGWNWSGWGYNGSAALTAWEAGLVRNTRAVAPGIPVGVVRGLPDAQPLFEGFLREITAAGYPVKEFGMYVFRCTSNSRKSCDGQTRDQLSNHSYGLAVDFNTTANPELTYFGVNGATACATPMKTDIPVWVVRAAERWGLYWGGYGWGGGCTSPSHQRSSVLRDPMHFEFRGTPETARAILARRASGASGGGAPWDPSSVAMAPMRLLESRTGLTTGDGLLNGIGARGTGTVTELQVTGRGGVPGDATAVALNVTVTEPSAPGFVTVFPCGSAMPAASNLNFVRGQTIPNLVIAKVGGGGRVCLYTSASTHLIADINASFPPASNMNALDPLRLMETRAGLTTGDGQDNGIGARPAGSVTELQVTGRGGVPADAMAVALNVTVTEPAAPGFVTVFPCGSQMPAASNLNYVAGQTIPNLVIAKVGAGGKVCLFTSATTHLVVDVNASFPAGANMTALEPMRLLESRAGLTTGDAGLNGIGVRSAGSVTELQVTGRGGVPGNATAVALNVTVTEPATPGYVTVFPCGSPMPAASNLNYVRGQTIPNLVIAKVGAGGKVCLFTSATTHLVVDVNASFPPGATPWTNLAQGATGPRVVVLQQALTAAGHPTATDGQFGPKTKASVTAFQQAKGLPATGVVDQATAAQLGILLTGA